MAEQKDPELTCHEHAKITSICRTTFDEKDWNLPGKTFCNLRHKERTMRQGEVD